MNFTDSNRYKRFTDGLVRFAQLNIAFAVLLLLARLFETFYIKNNLSVVGNIWAFEIQGYLHDLLFMMIFAGFSILPFLLIYFIHRLSATIIYNLLITLFITQELMLIQYYSKTSLMLGADLFGYSFNDIITIISASGGFSIFTILPGIIGLLFIIAILILFTKVKIHKSIAVALACLSLISLPLKQYAIPDAKNFKNEQSYCLVTNKAVHLTYASANLFFNFEEPTEAKMSASFYTNQAIPDNTFRYVNDEFPFLHYDDTPDVLGKYFNIGEKKPNFCFIIVESLGRAYSGNGAYLKSFTPFIDSLENHSLYWENAVSSAGRTFEVLPSVLASLPYGNSGFCELGNKMPSHLSLINMLKKNGYYSSFVYGGHSDFDNMALFMNRQGIDQIVDEKNFDNSYKRMPASSSGFTWGYGDREMFRKAIETIKKSKSNPRIDVLLTLSMHDPYLIQEQEKYNNKAIAFYKKYNFNEEDLKDYNKYLPNYASILYFDDAINYFFSEFKKLPDYNNTIFIITGDHRMSTPPISTQIDRFHVPIVIFSPMLKSAQKFSSVSSHIDVTPTIVAFLRKNYNLQFPNIVSWLGQGLDSCITFRNVHNMPFIRTKNEMIDYLYKDHFAVNDQLFKLGNNLTIDKEDNPKVLSEMQKKFEKFKNNNKIACENNRLVPDSLVKKK